MEKLILNGAEVDYRTCWKYMDSEVVNLMTDGRNRDTWPWKGQQLLDIYCKYHLHVTGKRFEII